MAGAMSPSALASIWDALRRPSRRLSPTREHFEMLIRQARTALDAQTPDDPLDSNVLAAAVALTWMGPDAGPPARGIIDALLEPVGIGQRDAPTKLLDLAVAYGCGWGRTVERTATGWDGRWDPALNALRGDVARFVEDACAQLSALGVDFPYEPDAAGAADLLLIRLCRPVSPLQVDTGDALQVLCADDGARIAMGDGHKEHVPPGAKAVYSVATTDAGPLRLRRAGTETKIQVPAGAVLRVTVMDFETRITISSTSDETTLKLGVAEGVQLSGPAHLDIWECTCGHQRCAERHRLGGWDPSAAGQSLASFVASAVKGPSRTIRTGSFTQGMLFALWAREGF